MTIIAEPEAGLNSLRDNWLSKLLSVAFFTAFFYDYCLTLKQEIFLFWRRGHRSLNVIGVFFVLARYLPVIISFLLATSPSFGRLTPLSAAEYRASRVLSSVDWLGGFTILSSEGILTIRTYALWGCSKRVLGFLLLLGAVSISSYLIIYAHANTEAGMDKALLVMLITILGFELVIITMTLLRRPKNQSSYTPFLRALYRDGIFYFMCIAAISLINLITLLLHTGSSSQISLQFLSHSIFSTRIVLHMRAQVESELEGEELTEMSVIRFTPGKIQTTISDKDTYHLG